jgi:hypothetical protein
MSYSHLGSFIGCKVDKNALEPPPDNFQAYTDPARGDRALPAFPFAPLPRRPPSLSDCAVDWAAL